MNLGKINFTSYAGIESLENFESPQEIQSYRQRRLDRYKDHVSFILKNCTSSGQPFRVLEVGSGNSGLLYALGKKIQNFNAFGVEISTSRWKFAEVWKTDEKISNVSNLNQNFSEVPDEIANLNCYLVIDNTFSYLAPENPEYPEMLLQQASQKLAPGGSLVLDIINYQDRVQKGSETFWSQFPDSDPFKYGLYSFDVVDPQTIVTKSVFIKRNLTEEVKVDVSRFYRQEDLKTLLQSHGFEVQGVFGSFAEETFDPAKSQRLVVLGRKAK